MDTTSPATLIIPGLDGSADGHWQRWWLDAYAMASAFATGTGTHRATRANMPASIGMNRAGRHGLGR